VRHCNLACFKQEWLAPNVKSLDLGQNFLRELPDFSGFENLKKIFLKNNCVTNLNFKKLPPNLKLLEAGNNLIKTICGILPSTLKFFDVSNNELDKPQIARIQELLKSKLLPNFDFFLVGTQKSQYYFN
jgi:Leucine-rich repeat (LRR) protein